MDDDWRLRVRFAEAGFAHAVSERLDAFRLEHELESSFEERVIVSVDGPELFCYTGSRLEAEAVQNTIAGMVREHGWEAGYELARWHPQAHAWAEPDEPLPATEQELEGEHWELIAKERIESGTQGYPDFEVRVQCRSEGDCAEFAKRLRAEGLPVSRRGRFLLIGAADEDTANVLAARFHREAPEGSAVLAEGTLPAVMAASPFNPFAVFGGLAGP